jgi:hypothetical protein
LKAKISLSSGALRAIGVVSVGFALAGCNSMTYGTGTSPAVQTIEDVAGIVSLSGSRKKEEIDYSPRAPIVAPPSVAALPPPGERPATALAANWPQDPDETRRALKKKQADDALYQGATLDRTGGGNVNPDIDIDVPEAKEYPAVPPRGGYGPGYNESGKSKAEVKKMFADARGSKAGSYDETGRPVRKYLTEPPATYREPDPNSPVEITEKPKKKGKFSLKGLWPF